LPDSLKAAGVAKEYQLSVLTSDRKADAGIDICAMLAGDIVRFGVAASSEFN
jgi:hypothetical protein